MHNHFLKLCAHAFSKVLIDDKYCVHIPILKYRAHTVSKVLYNIHHEPLSDLEKAEAIKRLIEIKGWNSMRAALTLGMDRKYLMTLLSLVDAPKEVKKLVEEEKLPPSIAGEIDTWFLKFRSNRQATFSLLLCLCYQKVG